MNSDWKNAKTDLPSNDRPVLAVVSGRPPYMHEGFHNKPMMAQFIRGRKPELDCWYIEGFPGWFEAEVTYWCDTPSLPDEKSADPVAAEPAPLPSKEKRVTNDDLSLSELAEKIKSNAEELARFILDMQSEIDKQRSGKVTKL